MSCFFLSLLFNTKKPFFPLEKGMFCLLLSVSVSFSLAFFWPPPFQFLLVCLTLVLVLFSFFLSFFILYCFLLVPCFCLFLSFSFFFAFVSWKEQHQNIKLQSFSSSIVSSLFLVSCLFFFQIPFSYLCFFPDHNLSFLFNINVFGFKKPKLKNTNFWSKGVLQQNGFFYQPVFCKCEKLSFFWPFFGQTLVDVQKHHKIGISAQF